MGTLVKTSPPGEVDVAHGEAKFISGGRKTRMQALTAVIAHLKYIYPAACITGSEPFSHSGCLVSSLALF